MQLKWTAEASSSIYATPVITDLYSDAHKDIIVPSFVNQLEASKKVALRTYYGYDVHSCLQLIPCYMVQVLDAADGSRATDWDGQHQSALHTSPLLFDIDYDGVQDILVATYDGDIVAFKDTVSHS